jgi:putative endonuclease
MAKHYDLGIEGEQIALEFLLNNGYLVLEKNYRYKKSEIDLIVKKDSTIAFVEIKTRSNTVFDLPENAVNAKKIEKLQEGALHYIEINDLKEEVRFDILTIIKNADKIEINHIIDAFWG